ncbi:tyrosine-type recombinase/integrase [Anabaena sp. UHCC 0451]|uniref:tyrosine-type recombinase/integrase n=1 Tax=Anabaena sp. UHCC 0451 TaxID=2055235 RepID=UPI002B221815|nr:tyrosine-type recombinase/integrase [Anabaena sp. UHCC 0451]MEA5579539.1 tyrosine-type recombinase/integrase [Anabaena sp. UHCC 0451]
MKNLRHGQAAIISDSEYLKIRRNIRSNKYKILLDIAWYTGERWGALVQLKCSDIYNEDGSLKSVITFRASTRKKRPDGSSETRQIPIHPNLRDALQSYKYDSRTEWMFPNRHGGHICWRAAYEIFMAAVGKAGLSNKGFSTHSTRRSFITKLHANGVSTSTIKRITGHKDFKSLDKYIEIGMDEVMGAISTI